MIITLFLFIICVVAICKNASKSLSEKQKFTDVLKFVTALFVVMDICLCLGVVHIVGHKR